jgi:CrcB protein
VLSLLIALAGGLGAGVRFVVDGIITHRTRRTLPAATLVINVTGSFLLGALTGWVAAHGESAASLVAGMGFLGGFTTFSTASVELVGLVRVRGRRAAVLLALAMLGISVGAALVGLALVRRLAG